MRKTAIAIAFALLVPNVCLAAKTTYIATNYRFNYVKIKEVKGRIAEARQMTHPVTIDEGGLRAALASIKLARSYLMKKEIDTQQVFDENAIDFLAPAMVKAFSQATPLDEVVISFLSKNPLIILRNDRLNIAKAWVHDKELHISFEKMYAKITGDVDKRGMEQRAISNSVGLRVKLELGPGQMMSLNDPEEIVLDLNYNYVVKPEEKKPVTEGVTMTGEKVPLAESPEKEVAAVTQAPAVAEGGTIMSTGTVKERLENLEQLKKDGLISGREYKEKKKEILKDL